MEDISQNFLRGNKNVKTPNVVEHITVDEGKYRINEIIKCRKDPIYFANTYYTIISVRDSCKKIIELYSKQEEFISTLIKNDRVVCLASRQSGKTTSYCIFALWMAIFNKDKNILICANKESTSLEFIQRIKLAYELLPWWIKPGVEVDGWNKKSIKFSNGCKISGMATSSDSARGQSADVIILDEFAFVPNNIADEFWQSVYPVISSGKHTKVIIVSTPNGAQGMFYETYQRALLGIDEEGWVPFLIDWWEVPGRDEKWKKKTLASMNGDLRKFNQEFGNFFHGSTYTLIPSDKLKYYKEYAENKNNVEPIEENIDLHGLFKLKVYEQPKKNATYVLGADTGEGIGKDFSTALVFDISDTSNIRQVASFGDNTIGQTEFAYVLAKIGNKYNKSFIAMENNGISKTTVEALNVIFEYENLINYGTRDAGRLGIHSHNSIKVNACLWLKDLMGYKDINIIVNEKQLIYEMGFFERKVPSHITVFQAVSGKNDDYMMAFIWAMYCIHSGISNDYFIVDRYFLTDQGIEIPHLIKNFSNGYYELDGMSSLNLLSTTETGLDNIDNKFENLKNGNNIINNDNDFSFAGTIPDPNDGWVNL